VSCLTLQTRYTLTVAERHFEAMDTTEMQQPRNIYRLLQLPCELRDEIYHHLFSSTRLAYDKRYIGCQKQVTIKPRPNALAILRTWRQVNQEAASLWPGRILFNFEILEELLDKLSPLPAATIAKLKHVRTKWESGVVTECQPAYG
jgi:hypothetical protein